MKKCLIFITLIFISCDSNNSIIGDFKAVNENAIVERISFDGNVASFGGIIGKYMPAAK